MSITTRGKKYVVSICAGGKQIRRQFATKSEAVLFDARARLQLAEGRPLQSVKLPYTLGEMARYTYEHIWRDTRGGDTAWINASTVVEFLGADRPCWRVEPADVIELTTHLRQSLKTSTVNRKLAALSRILSLAEEIDVIRKRPKIRRLQEPEHRTRTLTPEEQRVLFADIRARDERVYRLCVFLVSTGCRVSEALELTWDQIESAQVTFKRTKAGQPRTIPLTRGAREACQPVHEGAGPFAGLDRNRLTYIWGAARDACGHADDVEFVPHALRHTCASRLALAGATILTIKEWLGHHSLEMTLRYAHLAPEQLQEAQSILETYDD